MSAILKFSLIVILGLIPFGFAVIWILYRNTIIFITASVVFVAAMGVGIIAFVIGDKGFIHMYWAIPACLVWLVSVNAVAKRLIRKPLQELNSCIKNLAAGDLSKQINLHSKKYKNEVGEISESVEILFSEIYQATSHISESAEEVLKTSNSITASSAKIATSANGQAASIEQLSSGIEEMHRTMQKNTSNSIEAESISSENAEKIKQANDLMTDLQNAMSSISGKINIINDIAFQTNILALNAAVEAARAGEHGKGFAVVAAEVRKLAENSKKAADEIISLISNGVKTSDNTSKSLVNAVPGIEKTVGLVKEIALAGNEQQDEISNINTAISHVLENTNENATVADNLADTATVLHHQSDKLIKAVEFFKF